MMHKRNTEIHPEYLDFILTDSGQDSVVSFCENLTESYVHEKWEIIYQLRDLQPNDISVL
jgi:hypothetical protein